MEIDSNKGLKSLLHEIIYEADTPEGKLFDVLLLFLILLSVFVVMLDSIDIFHENYRYLFDIIEWIITVLFSIEYASFFFQKFSKSFTCIIPTILSSCSL